MTPPQPEIYEDRLRLIARHDCWKSAVEPSQDGENYCVVIEVKPLNRRVWDAYRVTDYFPDKAEARRAHDEVIRKFLDLRQNWREGR